jgi:hypothetical protein
MVISALVSPRTSMYCIHPSVIPFGSFDSSFPLACFFLHTSILYSSCKLLLLLLFTILQSQGYVITGQSGQLSFPSVQHHLLTKVGVGIGLTIVHTSRDLICPVVHLFCE